MTTMTTRPKYTEQVHDASLNVTVRYRVSGGYGALYERGRDVLDSPAQGPEVDIIAVELDGGTNILDKLAGEELEKIAREILEEA
jgi:hypothetical protein